jgi:serine/threonine-protein kinase HipA
VTDERLEVVAAEGHVGTLVRARGRVAFAYEPAWAGRPDATPLSVSMPLTGRDHPPRVVEPFLWGLLPDNARVLERWGREFGVSATNAFGLLAVVGEDLPGAVQIVRPERLDRPAPGRIAWLTTDDVAELLRTVRRDQTAWLGAGAEGRWSLAGAQPKIALHHDGRRWGRPSGRTPTTHILKPAIAGLDDHDLNEHLCLRSARRLGLRTVPTEIVAFGDERAIVVTRYDRRRRPGRVERIHQEDLCQALGRPPSRKYQSEGGPSPIDVVRLLREVLPPGVAGEAVAAFVDALAFNWVIGGPDAHAKNYALLLAGRQVRLAPFYDIASALAYPNVHAPKVKLAMKIGGHYQLSAIGRRAWERLAVDLRLEPAAIVTRVAALAAATADALAAECADPAVVELASPLPGRLLDAVAARAARCVVALRTG